MDLIVASGSAYRHRILHNMGLDFRVMPHEVDERSVPERSTPPAHAMELAMRKASGVAKSFPSAVIIAFDQICWLRTPTGVTTLHQPGTTPRAISQLMFLSGTTHTLTNAVVVRSGGADIARISDHHRIKMRTLGYEEVESYVRDFQPLDCAGAYRIEDGQDFVESMDGSGTEGVQGVPIRALRSVLELVADLY